VAAFITLKCPTCGANLHYEQGTQIITCDHCGNSHLLEASSPALPGSFKLPKRDWLRVGDYQIFLHEVVEDQTDDQRVIYINIEYANPRSKSPLSCRRNQWLLFDQENYSYEPVGSSKPLYEDQHRPYFGGERLLNLNMHARGWLAFIVPPTAQLKRLQFFTGYLSTRSVDILLDGR
jgi:DNA-directed RNA polymerase subunit RPC12/RpoP